MDFLQAIGILDLVFITILVISVLVGLIRGAVREILSLVGLAVSIYLAFKFANTISNNYVSQFFEQQPRISYIIAFVIIIVASIFAIALINLLISQLLKASGLSFVDRFLGLVFGVLRGGLFCAILTMVISFIPGATQENWWKKSSLAPFFQSIASQSSDYIPDSVKNYFDKDKTTAKTNSLATIIPITNNSQPTGTTTAVKKEVDLILDSVNDSLQETKKPAIELQSEPQEQKPAQQNTIIDLQSVN
ncbi:MAG: hypothetical protein CSA10_01320 [Cardiobacteriales bacterium]|nr:MAG: hypothetical protein CSA10_01320 [Cardiobacteriales bacterium]